MDQGSNMECQYALMSFGIPINVFPINETGEYRHDNHLRYLQERKVLEASIQLREREHGRILVPESIDVLLGRGKPFQGTVFFLVIYKFVHVGR